MKKTYFAPEAEVIELEIEGMLCASPDPDTTNPVPQLPPSEDDDDYNW